LLDFVEEPFDQVPLSAAAWRTWPDVLLLDSVAIDPQRTLRLPVSGECAAALPIQGLF